MSVVGMAYAYEQCGQCRGKGHYDSGEDHYCTYCAGSGVHTRCNRCDTTGITLVDGDYGAKCPDCESKPFDVTPTWPLPWKTFLASAVIGGLIIWGLVSWFS